MSNVTGAEREVLRIVRQLQARDVDTIAAAMGVSASYVSDLCRSLIQKRMLPGSPADYRLTPSCEGKAYDGEKTEAAIEEQELPVATRAYALGERIGEIKHKANLPSAEEIEATLRSNPYKTYEQVEAELTAYTLICPAKSKEVSWHFCSTCPHQKGIDYKEWAVQCHYEFAEEELPVQTHDFFSFVSCPSMKRDISIAECCRCRYHRGEIGEADLLNHGTEWGIICGFPHTIESRDGEGSEFKKLGKKVRIVPMRWG